MVCIVTEYPPLGAPDTWHDPSRVMLREVCPLFFSMEAKPHRRHKKYQSKNEAFFFFFWKWRRRQEKDEYISLVWLLCMQQLHVILFEHQRDHMTLIYSSWHGWLSTAWIVWFKRNGFIQRDQNNFPQNTFQPLQSPLPFRCRLFKGFHVFCIVKPLNHMNSNQCDSLESTHIQSDPSRKNGKLDMMMYTSLVSVL